jgi:bifunctional non-homologous end joining protein LigD
MRSQHAAALDVPLKSVGRIHRIGFVKWSPRKQNGRWPEGIPRPCIPTRSDTVPTGAGWLHEIKHDGYRLMVHRDGASVRVITRGGYDWSDRYPAIVSAARRLPSKRFLIDGEGVVEGSDGVANFALLHSRQHDARCYLIGFDLLELGKRDLRPLPLEMRKSLLAELLHGSTAGIVYADHIDGDGAEVFAAASRLGFEGIVSKRRDRAYTSGPCKHWVKIKNPDAPWRMRLETSP